MPGKKTRASCTYEDVYWRTLRSDNLASLLYGVSIVTSGAVLKISGVPSSTSIPWSKRAMLPVERIPALVGLT